MLTVSIYLFALFAFGFGWKSSVIGILFMFMESWLFPRYVESMYQFLKWRRECLRNRNFKEFDVVWLSNSVGGFPMGTVGTIVHVYGDGIAFEVELFRNGETIGVVTANEDAIGGLWYESLAMIENAQMDCDPSIRPRMPTGSASVPSPRSEI